MAARTMSIAVFPSGGPARSAEPAAGRASPPAAVFSALALFLLSAWPAWAALSVTPVVIDLADPARAGSVTVRNEGAAPVHVQARIFRWVQEGGQEFLEETASVAVSPPIMHLAPGADNVIRVVRIDPAPARGEESYRLIIDQLPDPDARRPGAIQFLVRHGVPVFFADPRAAPADMAWSVSESGGALVLTGTNRGEARLRIADLALTGADGAVLARREGLLGYVLGRSQRRWVLGPADAPPGARLDLAHSGEIGVSVRAESGPHHAQARIEGGAHAEARMAPGR